MLILFIFNQKVLYCKGKLNIDVTQVFEGSSMSCYRCWWLWGGKTTCSDFFYSESEKAFTWTQSVIAWQFDEGDSQGCPK